MPVRYAYRKDLKTWKLTSWRPRYILAFTIYVRRHKTLGTTPAAAAGLEEKPWSLEQVAEMTAEFMRKKEDEVFQAAFAAKW